MTLSDAQTMIALCELSYFDETPLAGETVAQQQARMLKDINAAMSGALPGWQVVWGPGLTNDRANMFYIAGNSSATPAQYAIAIRGTDWSFFLDWIDDFEILKLVAPPYNDGVGIAEGTLTGITTLNGLMAAGAANAQVSAINYLLSLTPSAQIYVTGHSLGGCLASAFAPMIVSAGIAADRITTYTFAAPTAGNLAFANYYDGLFATNRYYNAIDLVPRAWADLTTVQELFNPWPTCPQLVTDAIAKVQPRLPAYSQTGNAQSLPGVVHFNLNPGGGGIDYFPWVTEVGIQHASTYYAQLLGAPVLHQATQKAAAILAREP